MNNEIIAINLIEFVDRTRNLVSDKSSSRDEKLQAICNMLQKNVDEFNWVGFYLVDPEADRQLVLGPFNGEPTEHARIPFGEGICGQTADINETFVVQDVGQADNYISCSADVQAEIVVPVMKNGTFVAELDIDSHTKHSITVEHQELLQEICAIITPLF